MIILLFSCDLVRFLASPEEINTDACKILHISIDDLEGFLSRFLQDHVM